MHITALVNKSILTFSVIFQTFNISVNPASMRHKTSSQYTQNANIR